MKRELPPLWSAEWHELEADQYGTEAAFEMLVASSHAWTADPDRAYAFASMAAHHAFLSLHLPRISPPGSPPGNVPHRAAFFRRVA